jgi:hypothetical protein
MDEGSNIQLTAVLDQYEGVIFPQGSIRYEFNDDCELAVFIAAFGSDDPGLSRVAQNFFGLDPINVDADLGFTDFLDRTNTARFEASIPLAFALGRRSAWIGVGLSIRGYWEGRGNGACLISELGFFVWLNLIFEETSVPWHL